MLVGVAQTGGGHPLDQNLLFLGGIEIDLLGLPVPLPSPKYGCMRFGQVIDGYQCFDIECLDTYRMRYALDDG
jgi:hypothetical protein